ncbi:hypothetical protein TcYC6_0029850 [Trypanosoma cruzi]|nr:hypothetical protein TcYC6_0029850 [Trypanosoma cruzi]
MVGGQRTLSGSIFCVARSSSDLEPKNTLKLIRGLEEFRASLFASQRVRATRLNAFSVAAVIITRCGSNVWFRISDRWSSGGTPRHIGLACSHIWTINNPEIIRCLGRNFASSLSHTGAAPRLNRFRACLLHHTSVGLNFCVHDCE